MYRGNDQTVDTEFSEFNPAHLPKQTRLPEDGQSSFSSLDSDIAVAHHQSLTPTHKSNRFRYLEMDSWRKPLPQPQIRTPKPADRIFRTPTNCRPSPTAASQPSQVHQQSLHPFSSVGTPNHHIVPDTSRMSELLLQNENYRLELQALKASNESIQRQLRLNHDQLKMLRNEIKENGQRYHQSYMKQHQIADKQLIERLRQAERDVTRLHNQKQALNKKLQSQKSKAQAYQKQIGHLRDRISGFERQLYEISVKEDKLKHSYQEVEEEHLRKIAQLERTLRDSHKPTAISSSWQENFIEVVMDMVARSRHRQGLPPLDESLPLKKRAKDCWRYLKRIVLRERNQRQPIEYAD